MNEAFKDALIRAASESQSPLAQEVIKTSVDQRRFQETQQTSDLVGRDFYLLTCLPTAAALTGVKRETLNEEWQSLKAQFRTFNPDKQTELVSQIASGMGILEESINPLYKQVFGAEGPLENSDYLVTAMSLLCGYNPDQRNAFYSFMRIRVQVEGKQHPVVCGAIAAWLRVHPE